MQKNFSKPQFLQEAMFEVGKLRASGFEQSYCVSSVGGDYFGDNDTTYIYPDTEGSHLKRNTEIVKRVSTYRGNFESKITMDDFMKEHEVQVDVRLYLHPNHS